MKKITTLTILLVSSGLLHGQSQETISDVINQNDKAVLTTTKPSNKKQPTKQIFTSNPIFEQHQLVTHPDSGYEGNDISISQSSLGMSLLGGGFQASSGNSLSDDFTIPNGETWKIDGIKFYAYQTGSTTTSTITDAQYRVYNGKPNEGGSVIADYWAGTNLTSTEWTGIYRTSETDKLNATRPIMYVYCSVPTLTLTAGEYWVEVSVTGSLTSGPWCPPITIKNETTTGNSIQNINGTWQNFVDGGTAAQQGIPFDIYGNINYTTTFTVMNGTSPLAGANININATDLTTDVNGVATIALANGTYDYTVSLSQYNSTTGQVTVNNAVKEITVPLYALSIQELNTESTIYPNPTNGKINYKFSGIEAKKITITDQTGKVLLEKSVSGQQGDVDITDYPKGIYIIKVQTSNKVFVTKVIKE